MGTTHDMDLSDPATFARAYDEHAPAVYGTALRVLGNPAAAQDVAQDVFLRVWRRPGTFDPRRGDLGVQRRAPARVHLRELLVAPAHRLRRGHRSMMGEYHR